MAQQITLYAGALLTLLVLLGYLFGEKNFLFRIATYIFVGVAAGFVFVTVIYQVIAPRILVPLNSGSLTQVSLVLVPLLLSLLLIFKVFPRLSNLGNVSMGYLVGVGAAVAIGGAVLGTLFSQTRASINLFDLRAASTIQPAFRLADGLFVLLGTLSTLAYFNFGARFQRNAPPARQALVNILSKIGAIFIAITLGSLFAGVFTAAITAMIERLNFLWQAVQTMFF